MGVWNSTGVEARYHHELVFDGSLPALYDSRYRLAYRDGVGKEGGSRERRLGLPSEWNAILVLLPHVPITIIASIAILAIISTIICIALRYVPRAVKSFGFGLGYVPCDVETLGSGLRYVVI